MDATVRLRKFLIELDDYFAAFSYYDEEKEDVIIEGGENECYNFLMENEEFHLLGTKTVKAWIHIAFTDWELFVKKCHTLNVYS